jgi:xanthine dehydrogenase small subunit
MRSALVPLRLLQPRALPEALRMLRDEGDATAPVVPLAGGTDVYVGLNFGLGPRRTHVHLNLWGLRQQAALRGVRRADGKLIIGALTTFAELANNALVARHAPTLVQAALTIGGVQIQNRATLGGNIVNASPAADAVPVLAVAEAPLVLASGRGQRPVAIGDFFTGYRQTALAADELLVEIHVPLLPPGSRLGFHHFFRKVGTRAANAISKVVMAGMRGPRNDGAPRIAFGSVGPTVLRVPRTEAVLAAGGSVESAVQTLTTEIAPIDDLRSTAAYRQRVAANLLRQFWTGKG